MADEITHATKLQWSPGGTTMKASVSTKEDQSLDDWYVFDLRTITTTQSSQFFGDVDTVKYAFFKNIEPKDSALVILIGQGINLDTNPEDAQGTLEAQQGIVIPNCSSTFNVKAVGGSARLLVMAFNA